MFSICDKTKKSVFITENFNPNFRSINLIDEACDQFAACENPNKINLTIGVCGDENKKPYSFKLVKMVEELILNDDSVTRGYLGHEGMKKFNDSVLRYFLNDHMDEIENGMVRIIQTLSASGALSMALNLIRTTTDFKCIHVSEHYYPLYRDLVDETGGLEMKLYPYYDKKQDRLMFDQLLSYVKNCEQKSVFIFNTCAHNPTGTDIPQKQWEILTDALIGKDIILIMDSVFLGFISGDPCKDFSPVRTLFQKGIEFFATVSFSKNLGLYSERVGCLIYRTNSQQASEILFKRSFDLVAGGYMSPPKRGAEIVSSILSDPHLINKWKNEINIIIERIAKVRKELHQSFIQNKTPGNWSRILNQKGIFVFFYLSTEQIEYLRYKHFIFMIKNGRANISSLNEHEISRLASAIHDCLTRD